MSFATRVPLGSRSLARVSHRTRGRVRSDLRVSGLERSNQAVGAARRKLVAMQARAFPPCLPAVGRNGLSAGTIGKRAPAFRVRAVDGPSTVADLPPAEITWQIVVGAVAGATPFVVAGVEFSKRIIEQKKCEICGGSGLVMKNDLYVRCQGCGGFLPWQSWKRFFKG